MGQTLGRAAQWTSAREESGGKLEFTVLNEQIISQITQFVDGYAASHTEESKIVFETALTWPTNFTAAEMGGIGEVRGDDAISSDTTPDGTAMIHLHKDGEQHQTSVMSMEALSRYLSLTGEKKAAEVRAALEANRDPVANILGARFATVAGEDNSTYRLMEEIMGQKDGESGTEEKTKLKMVLQFHKLDNDLMNLTLAEISKHRRFVPAGVDAQIALLQQYVGQDEERHVLAELRYMDGFQFQYDNGCRAPPWRQLHGDICYFVAKPHDTGDFIFLTAATEGFYVNGGPTEAEALEFAKQGDSHEALVSLLREKSPKFGENVDKLVTLRDQLDAMSQKDDDDKGSQREMSANRAKPWQRRSLYSATLKWALIEKEDSQERAALDERGGAMTMSRRRGGEEFMESSTESEGEEEVPDRQQDPDAELPAEYWQIQKLVKYLKGGNQTATIIALCALRDFKLDTERISMAIRDVGGLDVLVNLLDTEDDKCKIGALKILREVSTNVMIRRSIADLGSLETMVRILSSPNKELKCLAAETIANVAQFRRARRTVRQHGGIDKLVQLLDCPHTHTNNDQKADVEVARTGAMALQSCCKSTKNKHAMRRAGVIPLLARLLKSQHESMLIPVIGTLAECATEDIYRQAIRTEGMLDDLVKNLRSDNKDLQMYCAAAIFKCAEEKQTRDVVRKFGGLEPLVKMLQETDNRPLLEAASGAIWKCAISPENVAKFEQMDDTIRLLVNQLDPRNAKQNAEEISINVAGALAEMAKSSANRSSIRSNNGIDFLVKLLTGTNKRLLINVTKAVGECAKDVDNLSTINERLDGVRLLWSLLKNPDPLVQANAAWAICPCIDKEKVKPAPGQLDAGEMVRSFVGGLELIVGLLKSEEPEVLAAVCAAIAKVAQDEENLAVITDHSVVSLLSRLTPTTNDLLRQHLAEAIAMCCRWKNNRVAFGKKNAVAPLVKYLKSKDDDVHRSTARALFQLSKDPENCITMHEAGVVTPLIQMIGAPDGALQVAAAGCIANIRRMALANEKARSQKK